MFGLLVEDWRNTLFLFRHNSSFTAKTTAYLNKSRWVLGGIYKYFDISLTEIKADTKFYRNKLQMKVNHLIKFLIKYDSMFQNNVQWLESLKKSIERKPNINANNLQEQIIFVASPVFDIVLVQHSLRQFLTPALFYHRRQTYRPKIVRIELFETDNLLKEHW